MSAFDVSSSMRRLVVLVGVMLGASRLCLAAGEAAPVVTAKVAAVSAEQGIVGLNVGLKADVAIDDEFWVLSEAGAVGHGVVYFLTDDRCAGRWTGPADAMTVGQSAVILRHGSLPRLRDRLPPGATVVGRVSRLVPGRATAWIDVNANSGLRAGDQLLVSRRGIPISRGRISVLESGTALTTLEPLVSNAVPEAGDRVELWPAPADARWGRLNSTVLQVTNKPSGSLDGDEILFPGTAADGIEIERLIDVYRGRQYIGMAKVTEVSSPLSRANMVDVATLPRDASPSQPAARNDLLAERMPPQEGDRVVVRASPEAPAGPLTAAVFNIQGDYCLIAAGELDGVKEGEKFLVRRQDAGDPTMWYDIALLTVEHVEPVDSGTRVKPLTSQVEGVRLWDMAERQVAGGERWRSVGIIDRVDERTRTASASVDPDCGAMLGDVVAWVPEKDGPPGGAVVIQKETDRLLLHVPPGWGELAGVARARVDLRQDLPAR